FSWKDFQQRNNSELVAIFGNFVNRAVVLTHKYFGGCVPPCASLFDIDKDVLAQIPQLKASMEKNIENYKFREALKDAMSIARLGNKYISDTEPWKVAKTDLERAGTILNISVQICADLAIAFEPFTPFAAERLRRMLDVCLCTGMDHKKDREGAALHTVPYGEDAGKCPGSDKCVCLSWDILGKPQIIPAGHKLGAAELLFSKVEDDQIDAQMARLDKIRKDREEAAKAEAAKVVTPQKEECTFDDFGKMDIRTATVLEAERVPKT
ncbi:MAG TPA: hypothetical protein DHU72_00725, partial [Rikenellaceae bacterium]|nr:hypothetical protein [Rikenellaceae bacterium]